MNNFREELESKIKAAGLNEVSSAAILENSGVLEAIERHGAAIPSMGEFQSAELTALREGTPITLAMNELISGYKQKFESLSNVRQEELLNRIAEKVAPPDNAYQERIEQLETAFQKELQSGGSVEKATELYNSLEALQQEGAIPSYKAPKKTLPSDQEIAAMGVSQQSALLYEFPEHSRHILEVIQEV